LAPTSGKRWKYHASKENDNEVKKYYNVFVKVDLVLADFGNVFLMRLVSEVPAVH